jgi:hypothetical protein
MADQDSPPRVDADLVARIISSYVRHHQIAPDRLAGLIVEVHQAIAGLGRTTRVQKPPQPAVPIRRFASSAGFARRCSAAICGSRTASKSPITAPVGDCRRTIH